MAGPLTQEGISIQLETELKSRPYVEITQDVLESFGVDVAQTSTGFTVSGDQRYEQPRDGYDVPGDFSSISYILAAGALAGESEVTVSGAFPGPQGDKAIVAILDRMGASIDWDRESGIISIERSSLEGTTVDVGDTPDLLPTIAVLGAAADGTTRITNAAHVRHKETDRVRAMAEELHKLGAAVTEREEELLIDGDTSTLRGTTVDGRNDHRVIMSLAVAGLISEGTTTIHGAEHVDVSFPEFFDVLLKLGAHIEAS
jgi:3-phosphoshikimate 1-carboxyvinyltransferase